MQFLQKHTWIIILAAVGVSFSFHEIGDVISRYVQPLLMILMFLSLLSIRMRDVFLQLKHIREISIMLFIIHVMGPIIVFFMKPFIETELFLGLLLVTSVPSGVSVVFLSKLMGGNPSKALPITAISNLASPFIVPAIFIVFANATLEISIENMAVTMAKLIFIPFAAAWIIRRTSILKPIKHYAMVSSQLLLFFLITGIIAPLVPLLVESVKVVSLIAVFVVGMIVGLFSISYHLGKTKKDKITFGITGSFKNFTLATVIALTVFSPQVALPGVVYALVNNIMLIPLEMFLAFTKKS